MRRDAPLPASSYRRLLRRADFVATGKGVRMNSDAFGLQTRQRDTPTDHAPRFGITITKKALPRAVDRNRVRRRLREALRLGAALAGEPTHDYVIVGRPPLLAMPFAALQATLSGAVEAVTRRSAQRRAKTPKKTD